MLVAYTDGVSEARNDADEEFGDERLADVIDGCRDAGAARSARASSMRFGEFRGTRQDQDDVTVLVVKAARA